MIDDALFAFAPGLAAAGLSLAILPWLQRDKATHRVVMAAVTLVLLVHYLVWRLTETLPTVGLTLNFAVGSLFFTAELANIVAGILSLFFLSRTRNRTPEVEANKEWLAVQEPARVDVFICTYNEEESILERTMIGATGIDYPNYRVWVLDDGKRPWLAVLAAELGCRYLTRPDNRHAKAGNINHALQHVAGLADPPDFISILDADFVPMPNFLSRTLCLFREPGVGVVQTPQHFINADPIQTNLGASHVWPDEQRYFFDVMLASKDAWGAAFCCGTSSVIRFAPLLAIGGFPTDSVTEDYLLTLRLKETGYTTSYLNEPLTRGLAPEGLKEYITQRGRWCLGFMQIVRGRSGPFSRLSKLSFVDRLSLIDSLLNWVAVYIAKTFGLIVPGLYLLFDIRAVDANLEQLLYYFLPFFVWQSVTMAWISGGKSLVIMSDVAQFIAAPAILKAIFTGLFRPQGQKFKVTAKGGDRGHRFIEWPLLRIYSMILAYTLLGILYAFVVQARGDVIGHGGVALGWSWYNAVVLLLVCFVCIEQPRRRKAERFDTNELINVTIAGHVHQFALADISITGARLLGHHPLAVGTYVQSTIRGQEIRAVVARKLPDGFAIKFDDCFQDRVAMIRSFYAGGYVQTLQQVVASNVGRAVVSRLFD